MTFPSSAAAKAEKPSVGRIVHYVSYGTPNGEYKSECRAAVVTAVVRDYVVSLAVLNPTGMFFNTEVPLSEVSKGGLGQQRPKGGTWHWPERV